MKSAVVVDVMGSCPSPMVCFLKKIAAFGVALILGTLGFMGLALSHECSV